jgi:hypothetical protein
LQGYRTNAAFTNHAILAFFRRIAEPGQLGLEPMLYQVGALCTLWPCCACCSGSVCTLWMRFVDSYGRLEWLTIAACL